jgi:hypothetical protein
VALASYLHVVEFGGGEGQLLAQLGHGSLSGTVLGLLENLRVNRR